MFPKNVKTKINYYLKQLDNHEKKLKLFIKKQSYILVHNLNNYYDYLSFDLYKDHLKNIMKKKGYNNFRDFISNLHLLLLFEKFSSIYSYSEDSS